MALLPLILAGAGGAFIGDQFKKAGERKEIKDLLKQQKMAEKVLGSPTGGFAGGTGFGPNMVFNPLGSYQNILRYQTQMGAQRLAQQGMQGATTALASNYQYQ